MKVCDRCNKELKSEEFTGIIMYVEGEQSYEKDLCKECANDIMNILDLELEKEETKIYDVDYKEI